jgi:cell shape-determining protein MreC
VPKLKNISPLGALDVPLLRTVVEAGQVIEVSEDHARVLLLQSDNYAPADKATKTLAASLADEQEADAADSHDGAEQDAQATAGDAEREGEDQ